MAWEDFQTDFARIYGLTPEEEEERQQYGWEDFAEDFESETVELARDGSEQQELVQKGSDLPIGLASFAAKAIPFDDGKAARAVHSGLTKARDFVQDKDPTRALEAMDTTGGQAGNFLIDQAMRPLHAVMKGVDSVTENYKRALSEDNDWRRALVIARGTAEGIGNAISEGVYRQDRLTTMDVMARHLPEFVNKHPGKATTLAFIGDVAADPTTYMGFGASTHTNAIKVGTKKLTPKGIQKLREVTEIKPLEYFDELGKRAGVHEGLDTLLVKESRHAQEKLHQAFRSDLDAQLAKAENAGDARLVNRLENEIQALDEVKAGAEGTAFASGDDLKEYANLLAGNRPQTKIVYDSPMERAARLVEDQDFSEILDSSVKGGAFHKGGVRFAGKTIISDEHLKAVGATVNQKTKAAANYAADRLGFEKIHDKIQDIRKWTDDTAEALRDKFETVDKAFLAAGGAKDFASGVAGATRDLFSPRFGKIKRELTDTTVKQGDEAVPVNNIVKVAGQDEVRPMTVGQAFEEVVRMNEHTLDAAPYQMVARATELFGQFDSASREKIGRTLAQLDDTARGYGRGKGKSKIEVDKEIDAIITDAKFTPEEQAAMATFASDMKRMGAYEKELDLVEHLNEWYFKRAYDFTGSQLKKHRLKANALIEKHASKAPDRMHVGELPEFAMKREFASFAQSEAAGFKPIYDVAAVYALRAIQHRRAVSKELMARRLERLFPQAKRGKDGAINLRTLPESVRKEMKFIGESIYPKDANAEKILKGIDVLHGEWKKSATVYRPSFGFRQTVSNTAQIALMQGMKALDPRSALEAVNLLRGDFEKVAVTSGLGKRLTGQQFYDEMTEMGILRGVTIEDLGTGTNIKYTKNMMETLQRSMKKKFRKEGGGKLSPDAANAFDTLFHGALHYTNFPGWVEDWSRTMGYINARRLGHAPRDAAKLVDEALFDYSHGLKKFEQQYMKRMFSFYSFNRFAVPFMAKTLLRKPGRISNLAKTTEKFLEVYSRWQTGEPLSDQERRVLPDYIIDQPHAVAARNGIMRTLSTFNNFTPLDVADMAQFGEMDVEGELDKKRTLEKALLSQMMPMLKAPIDAVILEKDSFSGRSLKRDKWNVGPLDAGDTAATIAGAISASAAQNPKVGALVGLATKMGNEAFAEGSPEWQQALLQNVLGWEEGKDRNGEPTVYVSPTSWYMLNQFLPHLSDALGYAKEERTWQQASLDLFMGVGTTQIDLEEERIRRIQDITQGIEKKERKVRDAATRSPYGELVGSYHDALQELNEYIDDNADEIEELNRLNLRDLN